MLSAPHGRSVRWADMSESADVRLPLPALPLEDWKPTKDTLHLWVQIVGKVRMASTPPRNHWWHVPLYVDVRGLTTRRMHSSDGVTFQIDFDFVDHRLVVRTNRGESRSFELLDGLSVAAFDESLHATLRGSESTSRFANRRSACRRRRRSRRTPSTRATTAAPSSASGGSSTGRTRSSRSSPAGTAARRAPSISSGTPSTSPSRGSAARAPRQLPSSTPSNREAYSHEVVSFGFWAGDRDVPRADVLLVRRPEPSDLREQPLRPDEAHWIELGGGSLALMPYEAVRTARDPTRDLARVPRERLSRRRARAGLEPRRAHLVLVSRPDRAERASGRRRMTARALGGPLR